MVRMEQQVNDLQQRVEEVERVAERARRISEHVADETFLHPINRRQPIVPSDPNPNPNPTEGFREITLFRGFEDDDQLLITRTRSPEPAVEEYLSSRSRSWAQAPLTRDQAA